jgi:hypothetical protein
MSNKILNFSVYITKKQEFNDFLEEKLDNIYPKTSNEWIDSDKVLKCELCFNQFSFFLRKHHCRACGHIFCRNCCYKYIKIPVDLIDIPKEKTAIYHYIKNIIYYEDKSLVCNDCYNKIVHLSSIRTNINICSFLSINDLYNTILINKKWCTASVYCLSKFRNIQYKSELTLNDYKIVTGNNLNISYLKNHSIWLKILLKNSLFFLNDFKINSNHTDDTKDDIDNFNIIERKDYENECWALMCSRKCKKYIDIIDAIDIMYSMSDRDISNNTDNIKKLINISKINEESLYYIFPYLFNFFKLLKINSCNEILIYEILCTLSSKCFKNTFDLLLILEYNYLYDKNNLNNNNNNNNINILKLLNTINIYLKKNIEEGYLEIIKDTINMFVNIYIKKNNYKNDKKVFIYPFDTSYEIIKINDIKELNSASKPVLVTLFISKRSEKNIIEKKIIIKSEKGLRKEQIVSQLIVILQNKLIEQMEKGSIAYFDKIPTYKIIMITNEIGIIEYLDDCFTLKSINQKNYTIQNYILENNKDIKIGVIKERFAKSLAISSGLSYILGLGDRHAGNIMISLNGNIIHIDYGYILENPIHSTIFTPIIRISSDMVDFLGGLQGEYYELFKKYIVDVFHILRLYSDIIKDYYHILGYENIVNWETFQEKLNDRFLSGMNNKDIEVVLIDLINTSSNGYGGTFIDLCNDYSTKIKSYII